MYEVQVYDEEYSKWIAVVDGVFNDAHTAMQKFMYAVDNFPNSNYRIINFRPEGSAA